MAGGMSKRLPKTVAHEIRSMAWHACKSLRSAKEGQVQDSSTHRARVDEHARAAAALQVLSGQTVSLLRHMAWAAADTAVAMEAQDKPAEEAAWRLFCSYFDDLVSAAEFTKLCCKRIRLLVNHTVWVALQIGNGKKKWERELDQLRATLAFDSLTAYREFLQPAAPKAELPKWRGVNLGGWFLLEGWMNQRLWSLVEGKQPRDEWAFSQALRNQLGDTQAQAVIAEHRRTFITRDDFAEIAGVGLNSVRLPIGYWCIVDAGPDSPFFGPCLDLVDSCMNWAAEFGLRVNLCLHGCPGFQSNHQACGRETVGWQPTHWDIPETLEILGRITSRYCWHPALGAITVVNEPSSRIAVERLVNYYKQAYAVIRKFSHCEVFLPVYQRWPDDIVHQFPADHFYGVTFDVHLYQCFEEPWISKPLGWHLSQAAQSDTGHSYHMTQLANFRQNRVKVAISEWSLKLPVWDWNSLACWEWAQLYADEQSSLLASLCSRLLKAFRRTEGWFFWTWVAQESVEPEESASKAMFSLREALRRGCVKPEWLGKRRGRAGEIRSLTQEHALAVMPDPELRMPCSNSGWLKSKRLSRVYTVQKAIIKVRRGEHDERETAAKPAV
mmetsp:Transcript_10371/g.22707  ORF Transcript_10371/g.22707 Transcript_10371/m.22707 type:complete len:611 (+) Transcript_10371:51-1883(+)